MKQGLGCRLLTPGISAKREREKPWKSKLMSKSQFRAHRVQFYWEHPKKLGTAYLKNSSEEARGFMNCYGLNIHIPPNPHVEALIPRLNESPNPFKIKWRHKVGPWSDSISVLLRGDTRACLPALSLSLSLPLCTLTEERPCEGIGRRQPSASQIESPYQKLNWPEPWPWTPSVWNCENNLFFCFFWKKFWFVFK